MKYSALKTLQNKFSLERHTFIPATLTEEEQRIKEECENDLHTFARHAWKWVEGGREFRDNWHIQVIAEHLELIQAKIIRDLLINQPPRTMKSTLCAVIFPVWCFIKNPSTQMVFASHKMDVATKDSVRCRRLILSPWFQKLWGYHVKLVKDSNTKMRFNTTQLGYRLCATVSGGLSGEGGDILVVDDGNDANDIYSIIKNQRAREWRDQVFSTRGNSAAETARIDIQQRLSMMDLTQHILDKEIPGLVHLCLPMEFEANNRCTTVPIKSTYPEPWSDPRKYEGELLWPTFVTPEALEVIKRNLGSPYLIAGQLQQRPAPAEGGIFKKQYWKWWTEESPPPCKFVIQSWDTALSELGAFSACTTWGIFDDEYGVDHVILLDLWRGRVQYPELRSMAQRMYKNYHDTDLENPLMGECKPDMVLVEAKANGLSLIQDLSRAGILVTRFNPKGSKMERAQIVSPILECGRVWVPARPPHYTQLRGYAKTMVDMAALFPSSESNDLVDSMTQALKRLLDSGWIKHKTDYEPPPKRPNYRHKN